MCVREREREIKQTNIVLLSTILFKDGISIKATIQKGSKGNTNDATETRMMITACH